MAALAALLVVVFYVVGIAGRVEDGASWMEAIDTPVEDKVSLWTAENLLGSQDPDDICSNSETGGAADPGDIDFCSTLKNVRAFAIVALIFAVGDLLIRGDVWCGSSGKTLDSEVEVPDRLTLALAAITSCLMVGFGSAAVGLFWVDMRDKFEEILRDRGDAAATVEVGNAAIVFFAGVILSIFLLFYSIGSLCYFTKYQ